MKTNKKTPTGQQVNSEIAKLKAMRPKVRQFSFFGDDNHAAIEAQIEVMEEDISEEDIEDRFEGSERESALAARQWIDGDESESPSESWKPLCSQ